MAIAKGVRVQCSMCNVKCALARITPSCGRVASRRSALGRDSDGKVIKNHNSKDMPCIYYTYSTLTTLRCRSAKKTRIKQAENYAVPRDLTTLSVPPPGAQRKYPRKEPRHFMKMPFFPLFFYQVTLVSCNALCMLRRPSSRATLSHFREIQGSVLRVEMRFLRPGKMQLTVYGLYDTDIIYQALQDTH